mmetsp:Transcript_8957/g.26811  ORF Transcript_8957/g.26811 Transcript_8957/m.26811 type:complete len:215 (+) Transcript_8957:618-1262(+)
MALDCGARVGRAGHGTHDAGEGALAQHAGAAGAGRAPLSGRVAAHCLLRGHGVHHPVREGVCEAGSDSVRGRRAGAGTVARAHTRRHLHRPGRAGGQRLCRRAGHHGSQRADRQPPRAGHRPRGLSGHTPRVVVHDRRAPPQCHVLLHRHCGEHTAGTGGVRCAGQCNPELRSQGRRRVGHCHVHDQSLGIWRHHLSGELCVGLHNDRGRQGGG